MGKFANFFNGVAGAVLSITTKAVAMLPKRRVLERSDRVVQLDGIEGCDHTQFRTRPGLQVYDESGTRDLERASPVTRLVPITLAVFTVIKKKAKNYEIPPELPEHYSFNQMPSCGSGST